MIEEDDTILLNLAFIAWKNYHLRQKNDWRSDIKADVHYSLQLQSKAFKRWQLYILEHRKAIIQRRISQIYYEKKIKSNYFLNLRWLTKEQLHRRKTEPILISGLIFCYCRLEVLICGYIYANLRLNYLAVKYDEMKWRTNRLKTYFDKLIYYVNYRIGKRNTRFKLRLFLRSKYDPEALRPYLKIWINFTKYTTNRKMKLNIANKFHRKTLLRESFLRLLRYKSRSQSKKAKTIVADHTYEIKIKRFVLRNWIDFTNEKLSKSNKIALAISYYEHKLKRVTFIKMHCYQIYKQNKLKLINFVEDFHLTKLKQHHYKKLKLYCVYSKRKRFKFNSAFAYYHDRLKRYYFFKIKQYHHYKIQKRRQEIASIQTFEKGRNLRRLKTHFNKWKILKLISRKKHELQHKSQLFYTKTLYKHTFLTWLQFIRTQQYNRVRNDYLIKKITLLKWKNYTRREIEYRNKLEVAKTLYDKHLLSKAFAFILKAGDREHDSKKRKALDCFEKDFQLQSKYYLIWKRKALRNVRSSRFKPEVLRSENSPLEFNCDEVFQWNRLCFQEPKIPDNLYSLFL